jgi:hypothetical protein
MGPFESHAAAGGRMNNLLIHAYPGARSGFVAAWLNDNLDQAGFDVGDTAKTSFVKIHYVNNGTNDKIKRHQGPKIKIKSSFDLLSLQLLLFLRKNVHTQLPNFTKDEYSLETCSKVYVFAKECIDDEKLVDYSLYDYLISFDDTFDIDKMVNLYYQINNRYPDETHVKLAVTHNKMNQIELDNNHACSIAAMILETEFKMHLKETDRTWSLPILYNTTAITDRYRIIKSLIIPNNYQTTLTA